MSRALARPRVALARRRRCCSPAATSTSTSCRCPGGTDTGDDPITVTVEFRDVLDLVPQSSVKVNDVTVGKVTDIDLDGYTPWSPSSSATTPSLPDNAIAEIRQTSLLGEKFVSLARPRPAPSDEPLGDGDVIPLERTGRNPEVEEVLGALSLLLNGGGVAQLKTIASELNNALEGREDSRQVGASARSRTLMSQLDENKADIVDAIEALNRLSVSVSDQIGTIDAALEELPSALGLDRPAARRPGEDAAGPQPARRRRRPGHPGVQGSRRSSRSSSSSPVLTSSPSPATTSSTRSTSS